MMMIVGGILLTLFAVIAFPRQCIVLLIVLFAASVFAVGLLILPARSQHATTYQIMDCPAPLTMAECAKRLEGR